MLHILWVKCYKQKCIFKVSLPVTPFGFHFTSKILEAVRISQMSSGLRGCWVHCHSCDLSNLSSHSCRLFPSGGEVDDRVGNFFLFTPVCLQRMYTNSYVHQLKQQETVFLRDVPSCFFSSGSCPRRTHWLSLIYISVGVRLWVCPADCPQLSTSDYAMFLAAYYTYT